MSVTSATPGAVVYVIPLTNSPQTFQIPLSGITYTLYSIWNDMGQFWALNIADSNNKSIVSNIPLITGADLLEGLDYLELGGSLYVVTNGQQPDNVPTLNNLGVDSNLYWVSVAPQ